MSENTQYARSRILEYFSKDILIELNKLRKNKRIYNNNDKIQVALELLDYYDVPYEKIGTGTNRLAILIDGYIFKLAMDDEGYRDNLNEFVVSEELTPKVLKCYETNGLISIFEYVTLLSMEDFVGRSSEILEILEELSKIYLFGDIGYVKKNYQNWGYRDDNSLVILDYAYMYKITGQMLTCKSCGKKVRYNASYSEMECPHCRTKYTFWDIRKGIDMQRIDNYIQEALSKDSLRVDSAKTELEEDLTSIEIREPSLYEKSERKEAIRNMKNKFGMLFNCYGAWDARNPNSLFTMNRTKKISTMNEEPQEVQETTEMIEDDCNETDDKEALREESIRRVRAYILGHNQIADTEEEHEVIDESQFVEAEETKEDEEDTTSFGIYDEASGKVYNELVGDELDEVEHVTSDSVDTDGSDGTSNGNIAPPNLSESPLTEGRDESPDSSITVPIIEAGDEIIDSHHHVIPQAQEEEENSGTGQEVITPDAGLNGLNETNNVGAIAEIDEVSSTDDDAGKNAIGNDADKGSESNGDSEILCGSTDSDCTDEEVNTEMSATKGEDSSSEVKFNRVDDIQGESKSIGGFFKSNQRKGLRNIKR